MEPLQEAGDSRGLNVSRKALSALSPLQGGVLRACMVSSPPISTLVDALATLDLHLVFLAAGFELLEQVVGEGAGRSSRLEALALSPVLRCIFPVHIPSTWEGRGWRTGTHGLPQLCRFEASLGYMRAYLQKRKRERWTKFRTYECLWLF